MSPSPVSKRQDGTHMRDFQPSSERAKSRNQVKLILTAYFTPLKDGRDGIVSTWNQHVTANEILGVLFLVWGFRAQHVLRVPSGRPHVTHSAATHAGVLR